MFPLVPLGLVALEDVWVRLSEPVDSLFGVAYDKEALGILVGRVSEGPDDGVLDFTYVLIFINEQMSELISKICSIPDFLIFFCRRKELEGEVF